MSSISYFQKFSQKENVHTNNAMLLLKLLYKHNARVFYKFICSDEENKSIISNYELDLIFSQQEKCGNSIIDGFIEQKGFQILIETKDWDWFYDNQLQRHLESRVKDNCINILLTLCKEDLLESERNGFNQMIDGLKNTHLNAVIEYKHLTFTSMVELIEKNLDPIKDIQFYEVLDSYMEYLSYEGLIDNEGIWLLGWADSESIDKDFISGVKYTSGHEYHNNIYLGLYSKKCISSIGKITRCIYREVNNGNIVFKSEDLHVSDTDKDIINSVIKESPYGLECFDEPHTFYLTDNNRFIKTNFFKESEGGLRSKKWFNLSEVLNVKSSEIKSFSVEEIANRLNNTKW